MKYKKLYEWESIKSEVLFPLWGLYLGLIPWSLIATLVVIVIIVFNIAS